MKKLLLLSLLTLFLTSCGSSKRVSSSSKNKTEKVSKSSAGKKATKIVAHAQKFKGTKYKFGGTDKRGMDCSGLVYVSYKSENIALPRVSREMATRGKKISKNQAKKGDLVFFRTNKNSRNINHVGLVVENKKGVLEFIHSSSSKGVIVSKLTNPYWKGAFVEVRRII
jgi:cell wall-associated NlpC family hydrolase